MDVEKLKYALKKLKEVEKSVSHVVEKFDAEVYEQNSLHSTFIFHKGKKNLTITSYPLQLLFDDPGKLTLSEYKYIEKVLKEPFKYAEPTKNFYVEIGALETTVEYDYDMEDEMETYEKDDFTALTGFEPCPHFVRDRDYHLNDLFEKNEVKEHFEIDYDHITKEFSIETEDEFYRDEDEILELRAEDKFINELFTLIHHELTGKFPKEIPLKNAEDNRLELLCNDYKNLYNHTKEFEKDRVFVTPPTLHFVLMDTHSNRTKSAGLYMHASGFKLGYFPTKKDFTFNAYEAKIELASNASILSREFETSDYVKHYELNKYEKQDTFKFFKELVGKHIRPAIKTKDKIEVDIRLDAGTINTVKVLSYDIILLYKADEIVGTVKFSNTEKADLNELTNGINELILEITK